MNVNNNTDRPRSLFRWMVVMAWRDSRGQRRILFLLTLCIVFGIGALVAIGSFRHNLEVAIDLHSRSLLGADLSISGRRSFTEKTENFISTLGGEQSREVRFRTMAYFPKQGKTRLIQTRALEGRFPFYGEMVSDPEEVDFLTPDTPVALVEDSLMIQYQVQTGDTVKLGGMAFEIVGSLKRISGENGVAGIFSPRIYIAKKWLNATELIKPGSIARHKVCFKLPNEIDTAFLEEAEKGIFAEERLNYDTVEERKRNIGDVLDNLYDYLNLVGFVALLLGGMGVAGAVQVYLREKLNTIAILRCLGSRISQAFGIYLLQIVIVGLIGSTLGAALGISVQFLLPWVLSPFLPFDVHVFISFKNVFISFAFGWLISLLFAFIPLLSIRKITPLHALRFSFENQHLLRRDPWFWTVSSIIAAITLGFCFTQTSQLRYGLGFAGGLAGSLLILSGLSLGLTWVLRHNYPKKWPYALRQGLSNLYRPHNRTVFLIVTLGMGTFLIYTLYLCQGLLLQQVTSWGAEDQPNMVLFDIQPDQVEGVTAIINDAGHSIIETVPIVTMRLTSINGQTIPELKADPETKIETWALNREYRSTYRNHLIETEQLIEGELTVETKGEEPIPVSVEESIAKSLAVKLGDRILFDVQGIPIETRVESLRKVDWQKMRTNFYVVFPNGILEEAPTFYALVTKVPDRVATADLQELLVNKFPNVSAIDLSLVIETITSILNRVAFVIRFIATFTIATSLVVLAGSIITSRYQRIRESVLLRTLGASSGFIQSMMAIEYLLLGTLASIAGVTLSLLATWALAHFVFKLSYNVEWASLPVAMITVSLLTLIIGLANSRGIARHPPLAILREEG